MSAPGRLPQIVRMVMGTFVCVSGRDNESVAVAFESARGCLRVADWGPESLMLLAAGQCVFEGPQDSGQACGLAFPGVSLLQSPGTVTSFLALSTGSLFTRSPKRSLPLTHPR